MTRRQTFRLGAALTACAYLLGWLLLLAHNVTEQHVVCVEHGDLVHADEHGHSTHSDEAELDSDHESIAAVPAHDPHEHCAIGPFVRDDQEVALSGAASSVAVAPARPSDEPRSFAESPRPPPISVLALAPKTSPPHHA